MDWEMRNWEMRKKLLGDDPVPLRNLVLTLTTSSGSARSDAESLFYSLCKSNPSSITVKLLLLIQDSACSDFRTKAAGLLRNLLSRTSTHYLWPRIKFAAKCSLKRLLLKSLHDEESRSVLEQLRGVVVELGSNLLPHDSWPELIFFMFGTMVSSSTRVQESSLLIFSHLAGSIESSLLPHPPLPTLRSILLYFLTYTNSTDEMDVRIAALLAAISLIHCTPSRDRLKLQDLLPHMVSVLVEASTGNQEELAKEALKKLTFLVGLEPLFFCWPELVEIMLQIAEFDELDEELRRGAVNLVVSLAKTGEKEPGIANMMFIIFDYCIQ